MSHTGVTAPPGWLTRTYLPLAVLLAGCGGVSGESPEIDASRQVPFSLVVEMTADAPWGEGIRYVVNGEAAGDSWTRTFESISEACLELESSPVSVDCWTGEDASCGHADVYEVCCWARNVLSSAIVKGTVYLRFRDDGTSLLQEGHCIGEDGTSTHGDGSVDAGP